MGKKNLPMLLGAGLLLLLVLGSKKTDAQVEATKNKHRAM
jgi:hypothetical protein